LSFQGKSTTSVTYEFLGKSAEAAVYSYVGISLYTSIPGFWSFSFITAQLIIIVVGRIIGVIVTFYAFTQKEDNQIQGAAFHRLWRHD